MKRVLFILKKNECYGFGTYTRRSSGLWNSTNFIVESLRASGVAAQIVEVVDNNDIDREVNAFRPDLCIIEALWVVPEKFDELKPLHPDVKFYVHMHSDMAFLALEGCSMSWISGYFKRGIGVIANSMDSYTAFQTIQEGLLFHEGIGDLVYLPNVYLNEMAKPAYPKLSEYLDIGCFGAVRPLKNQLTQAFAAIRFARSKGMNLRFWVNGSRCETGGEPVLKSLRELFRNTPDALLCESKWNEPEEFLDLLSSMDIGMQVSFTETFNVVSADYVTAGIPIVTSPEVKWASRFCWAKPNCIDDIVWTMNRVYKNRMLVRWNQWLLMRNSAAAQAQWLGFVEE